MDFDNCAILRLTQHKRFVPYGTHPNPDFVGIFFMLEPLSEIAQSPLKIIN